MGGDPNLVVVRDGGAWLGGQKQLSEHMLCKPCEDRIGRWEDYVARVSLQRDGKTFPARDAVQIQADLSRDDLVTADASALDVTALVRFAVSVAWRASESSELPGVSLGRYADAARVFLLGDGEDVTTMPEWCRVSLALVTPPAGLPIAEVIIPPYSGRLPGGRGHRHAFALFGMCFDVLVGGAAELVFSEICLGTKRRAFLSDGAQLAKEMTDPIINARKSPGLLRWQAKQAKKRGL